MAFISNRIGLPSAFLAIVLALSIAAPAWPEDVRQLAVSSSFSPRKSRLRLQLRIAEANKKAEARSYYKSMTRQQKMRTDRQPKFSPPAFHPQGGRSPWGLGRAGP